MNFAPAMKGKMVQVRSVSGRCGMPNDLPDGAHVKLLDFRDGKFEVEYEGKRHEVDEPCVREIEPFESEKQKAERSESDQR